MKKLCFALAFALVLSSTAFAFATASKTVNEKTTSVTQAKDQTKDQAKDAKEQAKDAKEQAKEQTKEQKKAALAEKKQAILKKYTEKELSAVTKAGEVIKSQDSTVKVLNVNNIVSSTKEFKFDTPPVIKGNRTLIPIRAITEGLGAKVEWNQKTQQATITKDGTTIVLTLGNNVALVNGKQVTLDTKASTMNNRTYVPMRFIMETFKLAVTYDEDGTIEVEEGAVTTTTDAAITTTSSAVTTTNAAVTTTNAAVTTTNAAVTTTSSAIQ